MAKRKRSSLITRCLFLACLAITIPFQACDLSVFKIDFAGLISSSDPDERFAESQARLPSPPAAFSILDNFIVITDTHFDATNHATNGLQPLLGGAQFILCAGDLAQNGLAVNYSRANAYFAALTGVPVYSVPGNHDLYYSSSGDGWLRYRDARGASSYSFAVGALRVIALDTANGTLGGKQLDWLKSVLAAKTESYCVVVTHMNFYPDSVEPFYFGISDPLERDLLESLFSAYRVNIVFSGHTHRFLKASMGGVAYVTCPSFDSESSVKFIRVTLQASGLIWTTVGF